MLSLCNVIFPRFSFEGWIWVLTASIPDLCILFTFSDFSDRFSGTLKTGFRNTWLIVFMKYDIVEAKDVYTFYE